MNLVQKNKDLIKHRLFFLILFLFKLTVMSHYKHKLNQSLQSKTKKVDLQPFIDSIPFDTLQQAIYQILNNPANETIQHKTIYYNVASIDNIFNSDIIQYMISFLGLHLEDVKIVNKKWNQLSKKNEKRTLKKFKKHELSNDIPYDEKINTFRIASETRNQLTETEANMGFKMCKASRTRDWCIIDLSNAISGDKFCFFPGFYKINIPLKLIKKNLSFIGLTEHNQRDHSYHGIHIYFDFRGVVNHTTTPAIYIDNSKLRIIGCQINCVGTFDAFYVGKNASLWIRKSAIQGSIFNTAIRIGDYTNTVDIQQTTISRTKHCIQLMLNKRNASKGTKLICRDNLFRNIKSYAIIRKNSTCPSGLKLKDCEMDQQYDSHQIENNKWKFTHETFDSVQQNHNRIYIYTK